MKKRSRARIVYEVLSHLAFKGSATITCVSYIARMPYEGAEELVRGLEKAIKILEKLGLE